MTDPQFDFCRAMRRLCEDISRRHPEFHHVRMDEVVVTYAQTRSGVEWGMQAKLIPMRFAGGALCERRGRKMWTVQRVFSHGREMLYILTFYLPRFLNLSFNEKLVTVFHELFHIGPHFDGDIRRFDGTFYLHTGSQKEYDRRMAVFADQYLCLQPDEELLAFLRFSFTDLQARFGPVVGLRLTVPKLILVRDAA